MSGRVGRLRFSAAEKAAPGYRREVSLRIERVLSALEIEETAVEMLGAHRVTSTHSACFYGVPQEALDVALGRLGYVRGRLGDVQTVGEFQRCNEMAARLKLHVTYCLDTFTLSDPERNFDKIGDYRTVGALAGALKGLLEKMPV